MALAASRCHRHHRDQVDIYPTHLGAIDATRGRRGCVATTRQREQVIEVTMQPRATTTRGPALCLAVALMLVLTLPSAAQTTSPVAVLERAQGEVFLLRAGAPIATTTRLDLKRRDRIITGETSRASIVFPDGSRLVLGSNAEAVVEDYLPQKGRQRPTLMLEVPYGPFRLSLADPKSEPDKHVVVRTGSATLAVKASDLWVGPVEGGIGILAIAGKVQVRNAGGSLVLDRSRQGTLLRSPALDPDKPSVWNRNQIERALTMVAFD